MEAAVYTAKCLELAKAADAKLQELQALMRANGDEARALDVKEAREYLEGAVSDDA